MFVHEDRRIYKYLDGYTDPDYDVLFDLIQAGLVEKVVEDNQLPHQHEDKGE